MAKSKKSNNYNSDSFIEDLKKLWKKSLENKVSIMDSKGEYIYLNVSVLIAVLVTIILPFITIILVLLALFGVLKLKSNEIKNTKRK
ncbi:DUF4342 domain-containing protein [Candidatus Peregrinibacteria bacterium]|nr:DUF4342 domain-containing protein [Candidatus Peregrinibacteria bacterium]